MNAVEIVVAALVFLLVGFGLCALGVFCYFMLKMMRNLQEAAVLVVKSSSETLDRAKDIIGQVKEVADRNFGDNSAVSRASKAVSSLSNNLPEVMAGLKLFNETFGAVFKASFNPGEVQRANHQPPQPGDESAFIPYSEQDAAQVEVTARAQRERLVLSHEELSGMRTDNFVELRPAKTEEPDREA